MGGLMGKLGLRSTVVGALRDYQAARGRALAASHVLHEADRLQADGILDEHSAKRLVGWYQSRAEDSTAEARRLGGDTVHPERLLEGAKALAIVERESIRHAAQAGILVAEVASDLLAEVNHRIDRLDTAAHRNEAALVEALSDLLPDRQ